jgi:predicted XRE-type DNA-binding protein
MSDLGEWGSGNVFADLERPDAVEQRAKAKLAYLLNRALAEQHLKQKAAADLLGCSQSDVSSLANYKLSGFSVARLMVLLNATGRDVEINVRPVGGHGTTRVRDAATNHNSASAA